VTAHHRLRPGHLITPLVLVATLLLLLVVTACELTRDGSPALGGRGRGTSGLRNAGPPASGAVARARDAGGVRRR
jgi:hypothetical protein